MADYRRVYVAGGTYFFTVVTHGRRPWMVDPALSAFREAYRRVAREHPFETIAAVVLPDHLHCIWSLPEGDADFSGRWRRIKRVTTNALRNTGMSGRFWQPRFWEHLIRDERDLRAHMDYVHYNPVRHGLVARPSEWAASSLRRYIRAGWYPEDWAADPGDLVDGRKGGGWGEPRANRTGERAIVDASMACAAMRSSFGRVPAYVLRSAHQAVGFRSGPPGS
ncbi:MAG: transposase [Halofilum sp. (in: g-proteobacteria)]|nr:transposase [Halofilum sp. (in: g-proteobacteria)]